MKERIGSCKWRVLAGALAVGVFAVSVSVDAADRNAARDKGQVAARANHLVSGPNLQVDRGTTDGGVAAGGIMELRWLSPSELAGAVTTTYPAGTTGTGTTALTMLGVPVGGQGLFVGMFIRDFGGLEDGLVQAAQGTLNSGALVAGLSVWRPSCPGDDDALCASLVGSGSGAGCNVAPIVDDTCAPAYQDKTRADYSAGDVDFGWGITGCSIAGGDDIGCFVNIVDDAPHSDPGGGGLYIGTLVLRAADTLEGGPHSVALIDPDGQTGAVHGNGTPMVVKTVDATLTIPVASCCYGNDLCEEGVTELDCDGRPASSWRDDEPLCPVNGGRDCAQCDQPNSIDSDCADAIGAPVNVADNQCTTNFCNADLLCVNDPIAGWDSATECCNPSNGAIATTADANPCSDDACSFDAVDDGLGTPTHNPSAPGSPCADSSGCTFACSGSGCTNDCTAADCGGGTQAGACDGAGGCTGTDINSISCGTDQECRDLIDNPSIVCEGGTCSCTEFPGIVITPSEDPDLKDNCFLEGEKVEYTVRFTGALEVINGYQITLTYDPSCLQLNMGGITYLAPWTQVVVEDISAGNIFVAAGVEFGGVGLSGDQDFLKLAFTKIGECSECAVCTCTDDITCHQSVCWGGSNNGQACNEVKDCPGASACKPLTECECNPFDTIFTTDEGQPLPPEVETCSKNVRTAGDLTLDVPDDSKVNVGCDSVRATVTWPPASASDTCGDVEFECAGQNESGKDVSDRVVGGGEFPRGASTFCCWARNECGLEKGFKVGVDPSDSQAIEEGCWTVQVNDQTALDIEIELSPTMQAEDGLTRCIDFQAYSNCIQKPTEFHQEIEFGGIWNLTGHFVGEFKTPSGQFACLTARDKLHTLRACALRSEGNLDCVDGTLFATFKGDPFFGGNWLVGGNLDAWKKDNPLSSHDTIDIQDFGQFVAQYLNCYRDGVVVPCDDPGGVNGDTPCPDGSGDDNSGYTSGNADINGDGVADLLDFTFVRMNFLEASKDCCCPGSGGSTDVARTEISVSELRKAGLHEMVVADLNGDGLVNMDDIAAFMAGELPNRKPSHIGSRGMGRK